MSDLKPCPNCGSAKTIKAIKATKADGSFHSWKVYCPICQVRTGPEHTKKDAVLKWNTRHIPEGFAPPHAEIYVGQNKFALVDWQDFDLVKGFKWNCTGKDCKTTYAQAWNQSTDPRSRLRMHSMIIPTKEGFCVDHVNGNGLDNRRSNLRIVTIQQNAFNQSHHGGSSKYKGVSFDKESQKWKAYISLNGKRYNLGRYHSEYEAAKAHDEKAIELHGEHAKLNLVRGGVNE